MKWAIIFIVFFISIAGAHAITLDDFVQSYDYRYDSDSIDIISVEINDCIDCNNLTLGLKTASEPGDYSFYGLFDGRTFKTSQYLFGSDEVELVFYPPFDSVSVLWLRVEKDEKLVYNGNFSDIDISKMPFRSPLVTIVDDYEDGGQIILNITSQNVGTGKLNITGYLENSDKVFVSKISNDFSESDDFILTFNVNRDGVYYLTEINVGGYLFSTYYATSNYSFSTFNIVNETIDNGNLALYFNSTIIDSSTHFFLFDVFSDFIASSNSTGSKVIFDGRTINESGLNGPYIVKTEIGNDTYEYETRYYNHTQFFGSDASAEEPNPRHYRSCRVIVGLINLFSNGKRRGNAIQKLQKVYDRKCSGFEKDALKKKQKKK